MMRILYWLCGLVNDLTTEVAEPSLPQASVCHMTGCGMPAHPGYVYCEGHVIADQIGFYNPATGFQGDS